MNYKSISVSDGRKSLPKIIKEVDEQGKIYIFTTHGKAKTAMVDFDLLEEFIENAEFGISEKEILKRSTEETLSLKELKEKLNAQD